MKRINKIPMRYYPKLLLLLLLSSHYQQAQCQSWQWAANIGNNGAGSNNQPDELVTDMAVDKWGNTYVVGNLYPNATVSGQPVNTWGALRIGYIARYDCMGNLSWAKTYGAMTGLSEGTGVNADDNGNVYFTGTVAANDDFGGIYGLHFMDTLIVDDIGDVFIAKADSSGNLLWLHIGAPDTTYLSSSAFGNPEFDHNGKINFIVGVGTGPNFSVTSGILFPGYFVSSGVYRVTLDTSGVIERVSFVGNYLNNVNFSEFAFDSQGNWYMSTAMLADSVVLGGQVIHKIDTVGVNQKDLLLLKMDSLDNLVWYEQMGDSVGYVGFGVVVDSLNFPYFTGSTMNNRTLQWYTFTNTIGGPYINSTFVSKFTPGGTLLWADYVDVKYGCHGDGNLALDKNTGELYFSGEYSGQAQFGSTAMSSVNSPDFYLCKVDPSGTINSATTLASVDRIWPLVTKVDNASNVYVGGYFYYTMTVNGTTHVNPGGNTNGFIAKYGFQCTTGLEDEEVVNNRQSLNVYPNPANDYVTIEVAGVANGQLTIADVSGRVVFQEPIKSYQENTLNLDITSLTGGIYFVTLQATNGIQTFKLLKL